MSSVVSSSLPVRKVCALFNLPRFAFWREAQIAAIQRDEQTGRQ